MSGLRFGLSLSMQGRGGKAWKPSDIFLPGDNGFLYDFSLADTLFQEATGITPAGVDQNVGLVLDVSKWGGKTLTQMLAGQPELAPSNGSTLTGWTINQTAGSVTSDGTSIRIQFPGAGSGIAGFLFLPGLGKTLHVTATIVVASGTLSLQIGGDVRNYTAGTYTLSRTIGRTPSVNTVDFKRFNASTSVDATVTDISVKEIPGNHASQTTSGARPVLKAGGLTRYDGSDDNLLTTLNPSVSMTLAFKARIGVNASRVLLGSNAASNTNNCYMGVGASGRLAAAVGSQLFTTIFGGSSIYGTTVTGALSFNGSTVKLYLNGTEIYSATQSGGSSVIPICIGARNNDGLAASFADADIYKALAINRALTPAEIVKLTNAWSH